MLSKLKNALGKWQHTKSIHFMMIENFNDLLNYIERLKDEENHSSNASYQANRYMMNYLAMARLFIDKVEENIKQNFTIESKQYDKFKQLTSKEYDEKFSYRFLWDLRNYTQHYGLPIHHFQSSIDEYDNKEVTVSISPQVLIKGSYNWKPKMLSELREQQEPINIIELIKEHIHSLENIYIYNLNCYSIETMDYIERYIKFREDNQYKGSLFYFEFKNNKEYRKANIENYKTAKKLGHDILVKEYLDELEKYGLLKVGIESSDLINIDFPPQ